MTNPWGDIGDFLANIMSAATQRIGLTPEQQGSAGSVAPTVSQAAPTMAATPAPPSPAVAPSGGFGSDFTDMLAARQGGIIPGLIRAHRARKQQAELLNTLQADPKLAPYAPYVAAGAPLAAVSSLYKLEHPTTRGRMAAGPLAEAMGSLGYGSDPGSLTPEQWAKVMPLEQQIISQTAQAKEGPMIDLRRSSQEAWERARQANQQYQQQMLGLHTQEFLATEADRRANRALLEQNEQANRALRQQLATTGKQGKPQISWRWTTDDQGRAVQEAVKYDPSTNQEVPIKTAGAPGGLPAKLNATQQKQVDQIHEVKNSIPTLQGYVAALPPNLTPAMMAREYAKYRAHGLLGMPDPRFTDYFDTLGQMKTALIAARVGGISRAKSVIDQLSPHIPDPTDMPPLAMRKLRTFDQGAFTASLSAILGNPQHSSTAPGATGGPPGTLGATAVTPDEAPPPPPGFVE